MNYATHNIEFAGVSDTGMPICPVCGKPLLFVGHYMTSEVRYLPEDTPLEEDKVISAYSCDNCKHELFLLVQIY